MSNELNEILGGLSSALKVAAKKPNALNYEPHKKQILFHTSEKHGRLYIGGNRSGKTTGGVVEDIWWLLQTHPYLATPPPPVYGRITTVDFKNGWEQIIQPVFRQWLPPSALINGAWSDSWDGKNHVLTLANGSQLDIKSYDQELEKFAGVPRHFVHFDEEPRKDIFEESKARLVDYGGRWWMTMTPVDGMDWTFDEIFEPSYAGGNHLIDVIQVHTLDNPHLPQQEIMDLVSGYSEEQAAIRVSGEYVAIGGLIFTFFDPSVHILPLKEDEPFVPPKKWTHYRSLDHGFSNPTAWLWHAVEPQTGVVVTYDCIYQSGLTVEQHAKAVKERDAYYRDRFGIIPFLSIADPAIKQRQATTGYSIQVEYAMHDINLALGTLRSVEAGLNRMNTYLQNNMWLIVGATCEPLLKEIRKYKLDQFATSKIRESNNKKEKPRKKDDHAIDSARYFFSFMPELDPLKDDEKPRQNRATLGTLLGGAAPLVDSTRRIDTNLQFDQITNYESGEPVFIDEYLGSEF